MSPTARRMLTAGESGRYEFKRDADAVSPGVLAALANWVALEPRRGVAHVLVGVDEETDDATGLVTGVPGGLTKGLDRSVARIQDQALHTNPIPVDLFIVEEDVAGPHPFLRIEVRPTMPPHYDDQGRRQTRNGRSTRALTDDELLTIYLEREAGSFAARFRQTSDELHSAVGIVGTQIEEIAAAIEQTIAHPITELADTTRMAARAAVAAEDAASSASSSADTAASAVDSLTYNVGIVEDLVRDLSDVVGDVQNASGQALASRLVHRRRLVWWQFTNDTFERTSTRAAKLAESLRTLLAAPIALDDATNTWELAVWREFLDERNTLPQSKRTLKWWDSVVTEVIAYRTNPSYEAPEMPDLRAELAADLDAALDDPDSATNRFRDLINNH